MSSGVWPAVEGITAAEVCGRFEPGQKALALLAPGLTPAQYLAVLRDANELQDAIRFLAHALPRREAVWWGCLCVWSFYRPEPEDVRVAAVLQGAVRWVQDPGEANREAMRPVLAPVPIETPAGSLGRAVLWSGGSMHEPRLPVVPPPPTLTGRMVSGAVQLSAVPGDAAVIAARQQQFLELGMEVAAGVNHWDSSGKVPVSPQAATA